MKKFLFASLVAIVLGFAGREVVNAQVASMSPSPTAMPSPSPSPSTTTTIPDAAPLTGFGTLTK
ncbi:MAG: hypothetical protein M3Q81_04985 [bacterium]|nr:hypothetical protein [bacterium]